MHNSKPPLLQPVGLGNFPSLAWLVIGTVGWILWSSTHLRRRNNLQYTDGGVTVDTEGLQQHEQAVTNYWQMFMEWTKENKVARNIQNAFNASPTGVHSEYYLLSAFLGNSSYGGTGVFFIQ